MDTKINPFGNPGLHSPDRLKETFKVSLDALGPEIKIRVYYLHAPDRTVPFEDTVEAINDLHQEGLM